MIKLKSKFTWLAVAVALVMALSSIVFLGVKSKSSNLNSVETDQVNLVGNDSSITSSSSSSNNATMQTTAITNTVPVHEAATNITWDTTTIGRETFYCIDTVEKLRAIETSSETLGRNYILTADLTIQSSDLTNGFGWMPIGGQSSEFTGIFDGNGHKISGLMIENEDPDTSKSYDSEKIKFANAERYDGSGGSGDYCVDLYVGLFGKISNAEIRNLYLDSPTVIIEYGHVRGWDGNKHYDFNISVGTLAGQATNSSFSNIYVTDPYVIAFVTSHTNAPEGMNSFFCNAGGLVGSSSGPTNISNCVLTCDPSISRTRVFSSEQRRGEDIGVPDTIITANIAAGSVAGDSFYTGWSLWEDNRTDVNAGGLIGEHRGGLTISNCYVKAGLYVFYHQFYFGNLVQQIVSEMGGLVGSTGSGFTFENNAVVILENTGGYNNGTWVLFFPDTYDIYSTDTLYLKKCALEFQDIVGDIKRDGDIRELYDATDESWFNTNEAFDILGWGDNNLALNLSGDFPIPDQFCYSLQFVTDAEDINEVGINTKFSDEVEIQVTSDDQYNYYTITSTSSYKFGLAYGTDVDSSAVMSQIGSTNVYNVGFGGANYLTYTVNDHSRKFSSKNALVANAMQWNEEKVYSATLQNLGSPYNITINFSARYLRVERDGNITYNDVSEGALVDAVKEITKISYFNVDIENGTWEESEESLATNTQDVLNNLDTDRYTRFWFERVSATEYYIHFYLADDNNTSYGSETAEAPSVYMPDLIYSLKITTYEGYNLTGLYFINGTGDSTTRYITYNGYKTVNTEYYADSSTGTFPADQRYGLVFGFDTSIVRVIADKGGQIDGRFSEFDVLTGNWGEPSEFTIKGDQYFQEDVIDEENYRDFTLKTIDAFTFAVGGSDLLQDENEHYAKYDPYDGYIFEGWTVYYITSLGGVETAHYYNPSTGGWTLEEIIFTEECVITINRTYSYYIEALFDAIEYEINLWDQNLENFDDSEQKYLNGTYEKTDDGIYSQYKYYFNIETGIAGTTFGTTLPSSSESIVSEGSLTESLRDNSWAIKLINNGNNNYSVLGNEDLTVDSYSPGSSSTAPTLILSRFNEEDIQTGYWDFLCTNSYVDAEGYIVVMLRSLKSADSENETEQGGGSWGNIDFCYQVNGGRDLYSSYTVIAVNVDVYTISVENSSGDSMWTSGEIGESKNSGMYGIGAPNQGERLTISGNTVNLVASAYNAFAFFNTSYSSNYGLSFYKNTNFLSNSNYRARFYTNGGTYYNSRYNYSYYLYNYGYEIVEWNIKLTLNSPIQVLGTDVREFYLIYERSGTSGVWSLVTLIGGSYYKLSDGSTDTWSVCDSVINCDVSAFGDYLQQNGRAMSSMCLFIDKVFAGPNKNEVLANYSINMYPIWEAVKISVLYNGSSPTSSNQLLTNNNSDEWQATFSTLMANAVTVKYIKYGENFSFDTSIISSNLAEDLSFAYFNKNSRIYCPNNAIWNFTNATYSDYIYSYNSGNGYYIMNFTSIATTENIYKVFLNNGSGGNVEWEIDTNPGYTNHFTIYNGDTIYYEDYYTYADTYWTGSELIYIFDWYSYSRYQQREGISYLWTDDYYTQYLNSYIINFRNYSRYMTSYQDSFSYDINDNSENFLRYIYSDSRGRHYIYLTSNYGNTFPVLNRAQTGEYDLSVYYKLNFWYDTSCGSSWDSAGYCYITDRYSSEDGGTEGYSNRKPWRYSDHINNERVGSFALYANFFREYFYITVGTEIGSQGRYGYALFYIDDIIDNDRYTGLYLAIYDEDARGMIYYSLDENFIEIATGSHVLTNRSFNLVDYLATLDEVENIRLYAGCDLYLLAFDQSKDAISMMSGEFDELIGYAFNDYTNLRSATRRTLTLDYTEHSDEEYWAFMGAFDIITFANSNTTSIRTGHTFYTQLNYRRINYSWDVNLEDLDAGSFNFASSDGSASATGANEYSTSNRTVNPSIVYTLTYRANAGYEFQEDAFTLNWTNESNVAQQTNLSGVHNYVILVTNATGWQVLYVDEAGLSAYATTNPGTGETVYSCEILYTLLANEDGSFNQVYEFSLYGSWLRMFYYVNQDSAFSAEDTFIGTFNINTQEIEFGLAIRYYNLDNETYFENKEIDLASGLKVKSNNKVVLYEDGKPYGMTTTELYDQDAFVYQNSGVTYTMVMSYMYVVNSTINSYDRQYYSLPYFISDLNVKEYNISNNFTRRVVYARDTIINMNDRTLYYVFAMREILQINVQVQTAENETNTSTRSITLSNSMNKSDSTNSTMGRYTNGNTLSIAPNANIVGNNYSVGTGISDSLSNGTGINLMYIYTYKDLSNYINTVYDMLYYNGVTFTFNGEEVESGFTTSEDGTLIIRFTSAPLNVNVLYYLYNEDLAVDEEITVDELIDLGVITSSPELRLTNGDIENLTAYLGATITIDTSRIGMSEDYLLSFDINGTSMNSGDIYTLTLDDYTVGAIKISFHFELKAGDRARIVFNIQNYVEGDNVGLFEVEIVDSSTGHSTTSEVMNIDQTLGRYRVINGRDLNLYLSINEGYYYQGFNYFGQTMDTTPLGEGGKIELISNFSSDANALGTYTIYIGKHNINLNLEIADGKEEIDNFTFEATGSREQTSYVNGTVRIIQTPDDGIELVKYFYMVGDTEIEIPHNESGTGEIQFTSEMLRNLEHNGDSYNLTIYVRYANLYSLSITLGEGSQYLGEGSTGGDEEDITQKYITYLYPSGEEVAISEQGHPVYFAEGTQIRVRVLLDLPTKYTVTISGDGYDSVANPLDFIVTLDRAISITISCTPNSYNYGTYTRIYNTLFQLDAGEPEEISSQITLNPYNSTVLLNLNGNQIGQVLRYITLQGNDAPSIRLTILDGITVDVIGNDYTNATATLQGNVIRVTWQDASGATQTKQYSVDYTNDELSLEYSIQEDGNVYIDYIDYKLINQII